MSKENCKKALIGLGVGVLMAAGIYMYFNREKDYLTWEEYLATVEVYNKKIEEIKKDCENDVRCSEGKVIFRDVKSKKDIIDRLNIWIEMDDQDPNIYKLINNK